MHPHSTILWACVLFGLVLASPCMSVVRNVNSGIYYPTITQAIAAASSRDVLHVSTGVYCELVTISNGMYLTIDGGYQTNCTSKIADAYSVITRRGLVDAGLHVRAATAVVMNVCVTGVNTIAINVRYPGTILTAQYCISAFNTAFTLKNGGGLCVRQSAKAVFENSMIVSNSADSGGGGIYVDELATCELRSSCAVAYNTAAQGGGILVSNASVFLDDTTVKANAASGHGGGVFAANATVTATNWAYLGSNRARGDGGGLYLTNATLAGIKATINDNTAWNGGGLCAIGAAQARLTACALESNMAQATNALLDLGGGGAAVVNGAALNVVNCWFNNNTSSNHGGGIACYYATLCITGDYAAPLRAANYIANDFFGNQAPVFGRQGGGIMVAGPSKASISHARLKRNSAGGYGGGLYVYAGATCTVANTLVVENQATSGGDGIRGVGAVMRLQYATIVHNDGDGVVSSAGSTLSMTNCIVWGHFGGEVTAGEDVHYCDIDGGYVTGTNNLNAYPMFTDTNASDYTLLPSSPCIEAGILVPGIPTDCMGDPRVQGAEPDMGCYETVPEPAAAGAAATIGCWLLAVRKKSVRSARSVGSVRSV